MCTQFCHILFYFLCTYVLNLLLFLFSTLYTRSNPGFTFTFLFLLITSSVLGKMFGYSSHTHTHTRKKAYDTPDTPLYYYSVSSSTEYTYNTFPGGRVITPWENILRGLPNSTDMLYSNLFLKRHKSF